MGYSKVSQTLKLKIKGLSMSFTDQPQPELLIALPNPNPKVDYHITISSPEFTSLCPLTPTQPDYATVTVVYWPDRTIVELKSLKLYLVSFRTAEIFHEAVAGKILSDLTNLCNPKTMIVTCDFTVRGGIHTIVEARYACSPD